MPAPPPAFSNRARRTAHSSQRGSPPLPTLEPLFGPRTPFETLLGRSLPTTEIDPHCPDLTSPRFARPRQPRASDC
eukprot:2987321-Rhodomonas_salina.1